MEAFLDPEIWPLIVLAVLWWVLSLFPVFLAIFVAFRTRPVLPRRGMFMAVVVGLAYGLLFFFFIAVAVPLAAFETYIAPQLEASRQLPAAGRWLVHASRFISTWGWAATPFVLAISSIKLTRFLSVRWPQLVSSLGPNNSFKPKPYRGGA